LGNGSISASVEATAAGRCLSAVADGLDSLFSLNLLDREQVGELLGGAIVRELGPP